MALTTSLNISLSGLLAQSAAISNVSSDLANASSTGYKAVDTYFSDLVSSYSSPRDSGLGGVAASISFNNDAQGTISSSTSDLDLAINGNGYFVVRTGTVNADGTTVTFSTEEYYTRCGDFTTDANGYLVNSAGYYLCGWAIDATTGDPVIGTRVPIQIDPDTVNAPIASTAISYSANLPAGTSTTSSSTATLYDSLGHTHDLTYGWTLVDAGSNSWELTVSAAGGLGATDYTATIPVTFNTSGILGAITAGAGYTVDGSTISFALSYSGADAQTISCDLSHVTQYADTSVNVATFTANGVGAGSYSSTYIDTSGNVSVSYSNGQTATYYEIPIATFPAEDYLAPITGTAYQATLSSGVVAYNAAGTAGSGTILCRSLEESTVDIATKLTDLIESQQVYSANAKVVSAVNEMMKTVVAIQ